MKISTVVLVLAVLMMGSPSAAQSDKAPKEKEQKADKAKKPKKEKNAKKKSDKPAPADQIEPGTKGTRVTCSRAPTPPSRTDGSNGKCPHSTTGSIPPRGATRSSRSRTISSRRLSKISRPSPGTGATR